MLDYGASRHCVSRFEGHSYSPYIALWNGFRWAELEELGVRLAGGRPSGLPGSSRINKKRGARVVHDLLVGDSNHSFSLPYFRPLVDFVEGATQALTNNSPLTLGQHFQGECEGNGRYPCVEHVKIAE